MFVSFDPLCKLDGPPILHACKTWMALPNGKLHGFGETGDHPAESYLREVQSCGDVSKRAWRQARFDPASPENSSVQLTIEGGSAVCQDTWVSPSDLRNVQNKALDMMDVPKHPQLVFSSERIVAVGSNRFQVHGSLSIRGIAKPAVVMVLMVRQDDETLLFNGSAEIRLKDYGLKPPSAALGLIGTADEMHLEFAWRGTRVR